jgi:TRAP-type C4-dicarboxylate transport system permease small subunit
MEQTAGDEIAQPAAPGPGPGAATRALEKLSALVNRVLVWAAGLTLAAMMLFSVAGMILRALGHPVAGSYEIIGWLSAAAIALALGSVQQQRGHVAMDLVVVHLGRRSKTAVELLTSLLSLLLFTAVTWYVVRYGRVLQQTGSLSETLQAIVYPWVYLVAAGCAGLTLALLIDFLRSAGKLLDT